MSIRIDPNKCIGCNKCERICPGNLIIMEDKKAVMAFPKDCWGCASCLKECKQEAISLYLSPDAGGKGGSLTVKEENNVVKWNIKKPSGEIININVDRTKANEY